MEDASLRKQLSSSFLMNPREQPLSHIRVLDLTRVLSGPFCTMLLADLGADVIKVEPPRGDTVRSEGAVKDGLSWYFASFNRNKRSVIIDLKTAEGRRAFEKLVSGADVLVENFRPGVLDRLGFDQRKLNSLRPNLITCSISGFGNDGPYRERPAFDFVAQAISGFMSVNGRASDPPLRSGLPISDLVTGIYAALGVTAALLRRDRTGRGETIQVSLTNSMISLLSYIASHYFATGEVLPRSGNDHPIAAPYGLFFTKDGQIAIAPSDNEFFARLAIALEMPELVQDPEFAVNAHRVRNRARLNALVQEKLLRHDSAHWVQLLNDAGVPCGPVYGVDEVFADPHVQSQDMVLDVEHPGYGVVRMLGFPVKFSEAPCSVRRAAPKLGEHTAEIFAEVGL